MVSSKAKLIISSITLISAGCGIYAHTSKNTASLTTTDTNDKQLNISTGEHPVSKMSLNTLCKSAVSRAISDK
jgi:hypothetical protein